MCLQDIQIARATTPYIRTVSYTGSWGLVLPGNPRRFSLILPAQYNTIIAWSHNPGITLPPTNYTYLTGSSAGPSGTNDVAYGPIRIDLINNGMQVTMPLFAALISGTGNPVDIVEILLNVEIPPLNL